MTEAAELAMRIAEFRLSWGGLPRTQKEAEVICRIYLPKADADKLRRVAEALLAYCQTETEEEPEEDLDEAETPA